MRRTFNVITGPVPLACGVVLMRTEHGWRRPDCLKNYPSLIEAYAYGFAERMTLLNMKSRLPEDLLTLHDFAEENATATTIFIEKILRLTLAIAECIRCEEYVEQNEQSLRLVSESLRDSRHGELYRILCDGIRSLELLK